MNKLASIGLALAALLFVGCGDDLGKTCYDEDDCSGGNLICARDVVCTGTTECIGVCSDTCVTDDDCGSEEFCLDEEFCLFWRDVCTTRPGLSTCNLTKPRRCIEVAHF